MPPPYTFAPLDVLVASDPELELLLDVDDDALHWVNVLLGTVKLLLLRVVSPLKVLRPLM
jgi:hypothetical protein